MARIDAFLQLARDQGCSDVHLAVGVPPMLRIHGELKAIKFRDLGDTEMEQYLGEILTERQQQQFEAGEDLDFSYVAEEVGRFRVNLFRKLTGIGATFRYIPNDVPRLDDLGLPPVVKQLSFFSQGLILVTGSTGTGKSTTLAALINEINHREAANIITLEDPIEFVHASDRSQLIQRELGTHVPSFSDGLRAALREDPDIILVGELRDAETIGLAMTAAETGHLVFGTLHTTTAAKSIDRILDAIPPGLRSQGKTFLAQNLHAVVTQTLVKTADSRGRQAILEILLMNNAIARFIETDRVYQIPSQLQTGREVGMQLMDQALMEALQRGEIDADDAFLHAQDKRQFQRYVSDAHLLPKIDLAMS